MVINSKHIYNEGVPSTTFHWDVHSSSSWRLIYASHFFPFDFNRLDDFKKIKFIKDWSTGVHFGYKLHKQSVYHFLIK